MHVFWTKVLLLTLFLRSKSHFSLSLWRQEDFNEDQRVRDLECPSGTYFIYFTSRAIVLYVALLITRWFGRQNEKGRIKRERNDIRERGRGENRAIYPASSAPLIKRQEQGEKRGKHLPKTRSPAYTSVKTNLSSIIGLTNKLTGDDSRWCHSKSVRVCFSWCRCGFEAHLAALSLLVKSLKVTDLWKTISHTRGFCIKSSWVHI